MILHLLSPRRPHPPVPVAGTLLSVAAHTALVAAVVGSDGALAGLGSVRGGSARQSAPAGEGLHWVGVNSATGPALPAKANNTRPPIAYVVPGHGMTPGAGSRPRGPRSGAAALHGAGTDEELALRAPTVLRSANAHAVHFRLLTPPLPDVDVAVLVAGVLSSAPDFAHRAQSPDDFRSGSLSQVTTEMLTRVAGVTGGASDVHARDIPIPFAGNRPPAYPASLARAGVGGRVVVEFLVDSTGEVDLASLRVVQSTDDRFTEAVRASLPALHFMPAMLGEHTVGVTVRQPFLFTTRSGV